MVWGATAVIAAAVITGLFSLLAAFVDNEGGSPKEPAQGGVPSPTARVSAQQSATPPAEGASPPPATEGVPGAELEGRVRIHPVLTPAFCLTEGHTRDGGYKGAIAVQRPCAQASLPHTDIRRAGHGHSLVSWTKPEEPVPGCLTVIASDTGRKLLEPQEACGRAAEFTLESSNHPVRGGYRMRSAAEDLCVSIVDEGREGAEATVEPCTGSGAQEFLIDPA